MTIIPLKVWLLLLLLAYSQVAYASEVFRNKDDKGGPAVLRLLKKPCTNAKVLSHLHDRVLDNKRFRAAEFHYWGKDWASCWVELKKPGERSGVILSIDEDGAAFQPVPRSMFKDESI